MPTTSEPKDEYLIQHDRQVRALSKLTEVNLGCRIGATGHAWQQVQPDWKPNSKGLQPLAKQCIHCTTIVRMEVSPRFGEIIGKPRFDYPDDYMLPSTGSRIKSTAVRSEWARRMRSAVLPPIMDHPTI